MKTWVTLPGEMYIHTWVPLPAQPLSILLDTPCGQVVHFRLVHDRETGRPKGFGFCEFADVQTAEAAQRNLNGFELNGRPLRVDSATGGERSADEVQQFQLALAKAIARTVASMPPERMFELMKQMKETVNNNPQMARHLLMENPQLAYALLQAQVVMRVVDPKVAYSMLHREKPMPIAPFHQQAMQQQNAPPLD
uniref:RRM domain-containing protein n=1 Tax=Ditylenchus dipsaci TaxID=166011 RepID=A0A915DGI1_9BILA